VTDDLRPIDASAEAAYHAATANMLNFLRFRVGEFLSARAAAGDDEALTFGVELERLWNDERAMEIEIIEWARGDASARGNP